MKNTSPVSSSRRSFLRGCATIAGAASASTLGFFGSNLLAPRRVSAAPIFGQKRMILINLAGGNDGLSMVVPTTLSSYYAKRPTIAIAANSALSLSGGPGNSSYRLHPQLTRCQTLWNEGSMAMINQVGYPNANLSHFLSQDIWSYGIRGNVSGGAIALSGWMARFADHYATSPTGIVALRSGRPTDFFGGNTNPLMVSSLSGFNFQIDYSHRNDHSYRQRVVQDVVSARSWNGEGLEKSAAAIGQSYDLAGEIQAAIASYSSSVEYENANPSRAMKEVATLIQAGFDSKVFYVSFGGFDTHSDQPNRHASLMGHLDRAIGDLATDLKAMGVWQDTVIVVISEFGRRHEENGSRGTDHGHGNCMLVLGGDVRGGVYGPDHTNADIDSKYGGYRVDFRTIYRDIMSNHFGVDPNPIFPEAAEISDSPGGLFA